MQTSSREQRRSRKPKSASKEQPGGSVADRSAIHPMLDLQNTVGNQAVLRLLKTDRTQSDGSTGNSFVQRDDLAAGKETKGTQAEIKPSSPPFFYQTSPGRPLPGEKVPGITDKTTPFTQKDRDDLKKALTARHQHNATAVPNFVENYSSNLMSLWTDYVTDSMEETAEEGPSFWYKLGGFLIRTTLIALVPEIGLEMLGEELAEEVAEVAAEDLVAKAIEKTTEFGGEYAQGKLEEKKTESAVKKRGAELRGQTSSLGGQLKTILHNAMQPILDDYYYVDWLNQAALEDLNLFRIPVEIPIIPEEQIRLLVAQTLAEFLHAEVQHGENKDADRDVRIDVDYLINPLPPMADIDVKGPNLFYKEFFDHRINEIPKVALKVFVKSSKYNLEYPLDGGIAGVMAENGEERWRIFADFAASFPSKTPLLIEREAEGPIKISGGSLYEQFYIHQFLNPSDNLKSMISDYVRGIGAPVSTMNPDEVPDVHHETAEAAQHFADYLGQSLKDSADYFLVTVIGQKRLGWFQNFDED